MKTRVIYFLSSLFSTFCFTLVILSCSSTKYVPEGQYLLDEVNIKSDNKEVKPGDLQMYVRQHPNTKWFNLFKTQLHIYSLSGRDSTKWLNRALRRVGDPPVIFSELETERSRSEVEKAVRNLGYMGAEVKSLVTTEGKKAKLVYNIKSGKPYTVRSVNYDIQDTLASSFIFSDTTATLLSKGMFMDINRLDQERTRLTDILQNNGYYKFNKEFITYTADTVRNTRLVDLTMHVSPFSYVEDSAVWHKQYYINKVHFMTDHNMMSANPSEFQTKDSIVYHGFPIHFNDKLFVRPRVLSSNQRFNIGKPYNAHDIQQTYENFNRLAVLRYTNIRFREIERNDSTLLDAYVMLTKNKLQSVSFEVEGTNSAGDLGVGASVSYNNRNIFRGSETFTVKVRGAYEALSGLQGQYKNESYTEFGAEASLDFPRFVFPFLSHNFKHRIRANSTFNLQYSYQLRPEFKRIIASTGWGYKWGFQHQHSRHQIDLLDISYLYMPWIDPDFKERYLDRQDNYILKYNYEDRLIVRSGYSYAYNSTGSSMAGTSLNSNSYTIRFNIEMAGNVLYGLSKMVSKSKNSSGEYSILSIPFAQYVKGDFDYARNLVIDTKNSVAWHIGFGIAYPYGNATMIPFEKRYFSGGANSVRGWSVRGLGPGAFPGDGNFMNQTGDLKLDASLEYRTNLFWKLRGAAFIDAGNVWTLRNYENQPDGQFKLDKFYKQIAMAYGIGFRLDLEFFILRLDGGMKAINPVYSSGRNRYPIIHPKFSRDFAFHFAVGYPF